MANETTSPVSSPPSSSSPSPSTAELYVRAGQLNLRLASKYDESVTQEARNVADALLAHVRSKVEDWNDFERRVQRSEEFSLHESAQLAKNEKDLKILYLRGRGLLDAIQEAEDRKRRFGR